MFLRGIDSVKTALCLPLAAMVAAGSLVMSPAVLADAVTEWSVFADSLPLGAPPIRARATAIMHIAMHDAVNSVQSRYESYGNVPRARPGASADAAARQAAASAMKGAVIGVPLPPNVTPTTIAAAVDGFHASYLLTCTSASCLDGLLAGEAAANEILSLRNGDGAATPHLPYTLSPAVGVYQPTPTTTSTGGEGPSAAPQFAGWADVTPFVLKRGSQFRAEPSLLFNLKSWVYTRDYNEVVLARRRCQHQRRRERDHRGPQSRLVAARAVVRADQHGDLGQRRSRVRHQVHLQLLATRDCDQSW
jgi:hypothetical protein